MEESFTKQEELITFANLKAKGRIISLEKSSKEYNIDLEDALKKADEIQRKFASSTNYIAELVKINDKIEQLSDQKYGDEMDAIFMQKDNLLSGYEAFLSTLPLEERENLEFYAGVILDRMRRIKDDKVLIEKIDDAYPNARNLDVDEAYSTVPVLKEIRKMTKVSDNDDMDLSEVDSLPFVKKVIKISDYQDVEETVDEDKPIELESDTTFFDPTDDLTSSIENDRVVPLFSEVKDEEPVKLEIPDSITYTMDNGDSLASLAEIVCDNENGWKDIYLANKDVIDNHCKEQGLEFIEDMKYDPKVLTGLTLVIPNEYKNLDIASNEHSMSLAA